MFTSVSREFYALSSPELLKHLFSETTFIWLKTTMSWINYSTGFETSPHPDSSSYAISTHL